MNKNLLLLAILLLLLPLHSKTLFSCSGSDDSIVPPAGVAPSPEGNQEEPSAVAEEPDMKVVVLNLSPKSEADMFYIRFQLNDNRDIIVLYRQNYNGIISMKTVYVGDKQLTDAEMMGGTAVKFDQSDSTAPLFGAGQYWHLFGQHGYVVPTIDNTAKLTSSDIGSVWRDQSGRGYTVGNVTSTLITLLPVIGRDDDGHDIRRWTNPNSPKITSLSHVSGGVKVGTIVPQTVSYTQLRPLMESKNRKLIADGKEINAAGVYTVKNLQVSETQLGYDPATVTSWFPTPQLSTAQVMAQFEWTYNFTGGQCSVHTTVDFRRSVEFQFYGATQQQTFYDTNGYKAYFMIPKAMPQNGVELDRPFHSPSSSSPSYNFYRTTDYLKDVDDPIDRVVAYLYDEAKDDYLIGMSAGLSLISSDTQKTRRIDNLKRGNDNVHYRIGLFSPSNRNKFYIAALTTAQFEERGYYVPNSLYREIDYYVSFFDPANNTGQVYWYKDGDDYVIYAHCQSAQDNLKIQVPDCMNDCVLKVVEKSKGAELLSSTIEQGCFSVRYQGSSAEYIVLVASKK